MGISQGFPLKDYGEPAVLFGCIIPVPVGIAYGYAVFTADDTDPEKVRERADKDMYRNKKTMKQL